MRVSIGKVFLFLSLLSLFASIYFFVIEGQGNRATGLFITGYFWSLASNLFLCDDTPFK